MLRARTVNLPNFIYFHFVVFTLDHEVKGRLIKPVNEAPNSPIRRTIVSIIATAARYQDIAMCRLCGWIIDSIEFFFKFWNRFTSKMVRFDWPQESCDQCQVCLLAMEKFIQSIGVPWLVFYCCPINIFALCISVYVGKLFSQKYINQKGRDPPMSCLLLLGVLKSGNDTDLQYFDFHLPEMTRYFLQLQ